jgi:hypothetical protein
MPKRSWQTDFAKQQGNTTSSACTTSLNIKICGDRWIHEAWRQLSGLWCHVNVLGCGVGRCKGMRYQRTDPSINTR